MSEENKNDAGASMESSSDTNDVLDWLIILAGYKRLLMVLPLLVAIIAGAVSLFLPDVYVAKAKLLPPQQAQLSAGALLSQLGGVGGVVSGIGGLKNPSDVYIGMLQSRTLADKIIAQFDLKKVYDTNSQEKARKTLEDNSAIVVGKDGLISISVEDESAKRVAPLANSYVKALMDLTRVLAVTEAAQRRLFFEQQLEMSKNNLAKAEMSLKNAIDTNGVISVDSDSRAIVETVGRLRAQVSAKEIELGSMAAFVTKDNPEYRRVNEQLSSLRNELERLENGRPDTAAVSSKAQSHSGLENIKILRDVKYHQMLYELLAKQYEAARLDEAKDAPVIQVLDWAIEPERKSRPRRLLIILVSAFLALLLAILTVIFLEVRQKIVRSSKGADQMNLLKASFFGR